MYTANFINDKTSTIEGYNESNENVLQHMKQNMENVLKIKKLLTNILKAMVSHVWLK